MYTHAPAQGMLPKIANLMACVTAFAAGQACLPVKDLDLGYNLVRTHDGKGAFVIVDHDELDPLTSRAPMSTVYAAGTPSALSNCFCEPTCVQRSNQ